MMHIDERDERDERDWYQFGKVVVGLIWAA